MISVIFITFDLIVTYSAFAETTFRNQDQVKSMTKYIMMNLCIISFMSWNQIMNKKVTVKYEIVADIPELKKLIAEFGKIGSNLNQIARHFNSGGIQSRAMHENINHAIACIFEMREQVAEMAGKNYGNLKAHRK